MTWIKWLYVGLAVYLMVAFFGAAYIRANDINNNKNTDTGDYFAPLLWPIGVVFIPKFLIDRTASLIAMWIDYREKKASQKKFNNVA
jgi:hypothetical protein